MAISSKCCTYNPFRSYRSLLPRQSFESAEESAYVTNANLLILSLEPMIRESDGKFMEWNATQQDNNEHWPNCSSTKEPSASSPWTHVQTLVHPIRTYRDADIFTPRQWPLHDQKCSTSKLYQFKMQRNSSPSESTSTPGHRPHKDKSELLYQITAFHF